jgi:hypothetical protein
VKKPRRQGCVLVAAVESGGQARGAAGARRGQAVNVCAAGGRVRGCECQAGVRGAACVRASIDVSCSRTYVNATT